MTECLLHFKSVCKKVAVERKAKSTYITLTGCYKKELNRTEVYAGFWRIRTAIGPWLTAFGLLPPPPPTIICKNHASAVSFPIPHRKLMSFVQLALYDL
jgi:hypothetical protein